MPNVKTRNGKAVVKYSTVLSNYVTELAYTLSNMPGVDGMNPNPPEDPAFCPIKTIRDMRKNYLPENAMELYMNAVCNNVRFLRDEPLNFAKKEQIINEMSAFATDINAIASDYIAEHKELENNETNRLANQMKRFALNLKKIAEEMKKELDYEDKAVELQQDLNNLMPGSLAETKMENDFNAYEQLVDKQPKVTKYKNQFPGADRRMRTVNELEMLANDTKRPMETVIDQELAQLREDKAQFQMQSDRMWEELTQEYTFAETEAAKAQRKLDLVRDQMKGRMDLLKKTGRVSYNSYDVYLNDRRLDAYLGEMLAAHMTTSKGKESYEQWMDQEIETCKKLKEGKAPELQQKLDEAKAKSVKIDDVLDYVQLQTTMSQAIDSRDVKKVRGLILNIQHNQKVKHPEQENKQLEQYSAAVESCLKAIEELNRAQDVTEVSKIKSTEGWWKTIFEVQGELLKSLPVDKELMAGYRKGGATWLEQQRADAVKDIIMYTPDNIENWQNLIGTVKKEMNDLGEELADAYANNKSMKAKYDEVKNRAEVFQKEKNDLNNRLEYQEKALAELSNQAHIYVNATKDRQELRDKYERAQDDRMRFYEDARYEMRKQAEKELDDLSKLLKAHSKSVWNTGTFNDMLKSVSKLDESSMRRMTDEQKQEAVQKALKDVSKYVKDRDTSDGIKSTNKGQARLDIAKNLKTCLERYNERLAGADTRIKELKTIESDMKSRLVPDKTLAQVALGRNEPKISNDFQAEAGMMNDLYEERRKESVKSAEEPKADKAKDKPKKEKHKDKKKDKKKDRKIGEPVKDLK